MPQALERISGKVVVVGSLNADLTVVTQRLPLPGETVSGEGLRILPGGKSANQAVQAALLGAEVHMVGAVGEDGNGEILRQSLKAARVNQDFVHSISVSTGTALITVDKSGENTIVVSPGANGLVDATLVAEAEELIASADTLGLCLEIPYEAVLEAARIANKHQTKVVFNFSPILPVSDELWPLIDVLAVNEHELAEVLRSTKILRSQALSVEDEEELSFEPQDMRSWEIARQKLSEIGISQAVITLGSAGSVVIEPEEISILEACVTTAVDTTGCGDAYMATLLAGLASSFSLKDSSRLAAMVAAYAAGGEGAQNSYGRSKEIIRQFS